MGFQWPRRFLGLPLHPMLVHFPLAFWLAVPVFDALALTRGPEPWWGVALALTGTGSVIGLFALLSGLLDYIHLSETGSNDVRLAARHGVRTTVAWCLMSGKLVVALWSGSDTTFILGCTVLDVLTAALLLQGAFFGTRITYGRYGE